MSGRHTKPAVMIACVGLAGLAARAAAAPDFSVVTTLGDSLTMPQPIDTYAELTCQQLGVVPINLAVGGATSASLLTQQQHTNAVNYGTTFTFLWIGGNDMLAAADNYDLFTAGETGWIDAYAVNFATALDTLIAGGADVIGFPAGVIVGPRQRPIVRENMEAYTAALQSVADARGVPVVDVFTGWEQMLANPPTAYGHTVTNTVGDPLLGHLWLDSIHPNQLGHRILANMFIDTMNDTWGLGIDHVPLPEPATTCLLLPGVVGLFRRRRGIRRCPA
jgi:lysophospholipase L1-like esterase